MKGLYIHIPFCVKKCDYCDFVSFSGCENYFDKYIDAVINEMDSYKGQAVDTIFIGGGTPSVLSAELIEKLCSAVREQFAVAHNVEWTIEVNPGTVTAEKIRAMREGGINRVSVGVQSFNDTELRAVGRIHNAETAIDTVNKLHDAGFANISIDLMESLPYQTADSFKHSLATAVSLPVTHISVYSLIIEDGTPIKEKYDKGVYAMPDEDSDRELYRYTGDFLRVNGFGRYEISNYSKADFESKHNIKYWDCDEYIGIGLNAHSYVGGVRYYNTSVLSEYLDGTTRVGEEVLSREDKMGEFMMLGLRKTCGVGKSEFYRRFGVYPCDVWGEAVKKFEAMGLMSENGDFYALTERGLDVANSVMCEFL